ncbi:MAG: tRNA epoxyqueuosine(34) reductase QueG [Gammaproteobacteria bacterium]|nr:MAG: tRNA epoxyqueuosine(34) reductase QueG [Gammaproteobacteria bacterium]
MKDPADTQGISAVDQAELANQIKRWGLELGFQKVGISGIELEIDEARLLAWLAAGHHGCMDYMQRHGTRRSRPQELIPGSARVISARMDYWPASAASARTVLADPSLAYVSRYALGRDYHKVLRRRLQRLANRIIEETGPMRYRVFSDSAPVLEKPLARNGGLGWIGKHTNLIDRHAGSWFFLGEIYTDLPLPPDSEGADHCGTCSACIDACPTGAIVKPYVLDARLCISYLTIEFRGSIPEHLRPLMGNRIFGCDDCQLVCPWNRFATDTKEPDFLPRNGLDSSDLTTFFLWTETDFLHKTAGTPLRRIGHESWLRNIAVALGNAPHSAKIIAALSKRHEHPSAIVREHVIWALARQQAQVST